MMPEAFEGPQVTGSLTAAGAAAVGLGPARRSWPAAAIRRRAPSAWASSEPAR